MKVKMTFYSDEGSFVPVVDVTLEVKQHTYGLQYEGLYDIEKFIENNYADKLTKTEEYAKRLQEREAKEKEESDD